MSGAEEIASLIAQADAARRAGQDTTALWSTIIARAPDHPRALFHQGQRAMEARRPGQAADFFARAGRAAPGEAAIAFHEALAHRALADPASEMAALDRALSLDPDHLAALLGKGMLLQRTGLEPAAARFLQRAVAAAPDENLLSKPLRDGLEEARALVARDAHRRQAFLEHAVEALPLSGRARECLNILAGTARPFVHQAEMMLFPQLPALGFYDRAHFSWLAPLEAVADAIAAEVAGLIAQDAPGFRPYVSLPANEPLRQWKTLNYSPKWNAYYLWQDGARLDDQCARAPVTAAALAALPQLTIPGFAPTAFFSLLAPGTHLPAHGGSTNIRLTAHLPLIVPDGCRFRVGNEERTWRKGEAWVFDDTIEHEAWNDSGQLRAILIFDVWNPLLTGAEREAAAALLQAQRRYQQNR